MRKIYISGKITGLQPQIAEQHFAKAESHIINSGHIPVNPLNILPFQEHLTWQDYMRADIEALKTCDVIYMLTNYLDSTGAKIELQIAKFLGLEIIYQ